MTKSELIEIITAKQKHLPAKDVELALKQMLEIMSDSLSQGDRIEIRGFGSFSLHFRPPRQGRNPKTGEAVALAGKYVPHFKPGKDLRERVNSGADRPIRDRVRLTSRTKSGTETDSYGSFSRGWAWNALFAGHQGIAEGNAAYRR
jgi:integration host factor subunit beta